MFCPHRLELLDRQAGLDAVYNSVLLGGFSLSFLRYGGPVRITPGQLQSFFLVNIPLRGTAEFRAGRTSVVAGSNRGAVLSPHDAIDMCWAADTQQVIVRFEKEPLERTLTKLTGDAVDAPLRFEAGLEFRLPRVRSWLRVVSFVREELESQDSLSHNPLAAAQLEELLTTGLLLAQPSNYSAHLDVDPPSVTSREVRRAVDYIHAHAAEPLTVGMIADAVNAGSRSLQSAFRRDLGTTPMAYLRNLRLEAAHAALIAGGTTVTEAALRSGFTHLGRFALAYRAKFGVQPSQDRR